MGTALEKTILAIITLNREKVGGGSPIFYADNVEELQHLAFTMEKILDAMAHTLSDDTMIIVKHF
ncbi:hypothetical protein [Ammoniphilus sp. CFH 90114]|uniref:capping complex subunit for YIEGIA n=1 Tax=Ammoniphilus sp. CFH 90114 TaxID=2493665 RepID=UPI00100F5536|nr:hypothetical protein [Ammoniphilus sp. CFH 90114]RXT13889.1 hypothetical protein EIZ39_07060 [Ammoniphilus sp. CFH 90114]